MIPGPKPVNTWQAVPASVYFRGRCGRSAAKSVDVEENGLSDQQPACPYPSRRELRSRVEAEHREQAPSRAPRPNRRGALKVGLLASLAAMTVAVPLSGFVGANSSVELPARALGAVAGSSWANGEVLAASTALEGSQTAASRARVRAPLTLTTCLPSGESANGDRAVTVDPTTIYWPLPQGSFEITSPFSMRVSPISGQLLMHEGIDMSAPMGTPIHSVYSGVVVEVSENSHSGALVKIKHTRDDGSVFYTMYLHQYMNEILVKEGQTVEAGQRIGAVGSNGWSTGPHLHFEVHDSNDQPVDPQAWLADENAIYVGEQACS